MIGINVRGVRQRILIAHQILASKYLSVVRIDLGHEQTKRIL